MTYTFDWNSDRYLKHIVDNKLDQIWYGFCNPKSIDGIRTAAYTPQYPFDDNLNLFEIPCRRKGCSGRWIIPLEDRVRKVIFKSRCNGTINGSACGGYKIWLYRWRAKNDQTKLHFSDPNMIRHYGKLGRSFYATNILYDKAIVNKNRYFVDETLARAVTLTIDCDIIRGNICDSKNKEMLGLSLDLIREELDTFVGGSYSIRTSGNGIYIELHHLLVRENIFERCAMFNAWISYMNDKIKEKGVTGIKLDSINMPSRVYKLIGSIHQTLDLVSTPLEYDIRFGSIDSDQFKLKNWSIDKYIDDEQHRERLQYYNRYDENDKSSFRAFLNEFTEKELGSGTGPHKLKYHYKVPVEAITGEEQKLDLEDTLEDTEELNKALAIYDEYVGWHNIDVPYGSARFRKTGAGIEMEIDMEEKDAIKVFYNTWKKETKKDEER